MRRNHNRQSTFRQVVAMAMGLAALGMGTPKINAAVSQAENSTQQQSRKDAVQEKHTPVRPVNKKSIFHGAGDSNPYKHNVTPKGNQRQYRKWLRQNPNMKKSKKVKS
jgi:hypothetical protein